MITDEQRIKINELISATERMISRIEKGVVKSQEAEDFFAEQIRIVKELFDKNSDEWRVIDRWENENDFKWHPVYKSGSYAGDKEKNKLTKLLELLNHLVPSGFVELKEEFLFTSLQSYEAKRFITSLFRKAVRDLMIVDEYLDDQFFDYLDVVSDNVNIRIITGDQKQIFWTLLKELRKKRERIEARVNKKSHCRYIMIDQSMIYSMDASLNTIGKKDFMIHKLKDKEEIEKVKKELELYWEMGKQN